MERKYDSCIEFSIYTNPNNKEYTMSFTLDWKFGEMLNYMCNLYNINPDTIITVRHSFVKRYKHSKDD